MAKATKAPNTPALVPHLTVDNAAAAIDFYKKAFGASEIMRHPAPDGKKLMHAAVLVNGSPVMLNDDFPEFTGGSKTPKSLGGSPVTIHLNVPDVDAAWQRAVKAGAEVSEPLADQFWGDRYGKVRDPYGHEWSMSTTKTKPSEAELRKGAEKAFSKPKAGKRAPSPAPAKAAAGRASAKLGTKKR